MAFPTKQQLVRGVAILLFFSLTLAEVPAQQSFPVISTVDEPTIAGRPVQLDAQKKLLPWPMPGDTGYSYSAYFLSQWTILWDQFNRQRLPYYYCCFDFDRTTFELIPEKHWVNSTAYLRAMMQGFIERLYPYTGDPRTLRFLEDLVDYELENGLTPEGYVWARVPYPSANPGDKHYTGWSAHAEDFVEPHVIGEDGYAYLRLYEMTGKTKYLRAAIRCAQALVKNFQAGDETHSPWPYRCYARDGKIEGPHLGPYSANVVEPIMLFDELIRLQQGEVESYKRVRKGALDWLNKYPMQNNIWSGYFEDPSPDMNNLNQVIPLEYARYMLLHPEADPEWRQHVPKLIDWVKTTPKWPKYRVHGATVTTEQGNGKEFCCNLPNQCCDSHTARLAAVEAFYYSKTGDPVYKEEAYRSFNWVTYFQGLSGAAHAPYTDQWWFTDEFSDGPRRLMDAFWAVPEWAPADESHLVGSSSPVTKIAYATSSVTYSTFDPSSLDVLRLDFDPEFVTADGVPLSARSDLQKEGYTFDQKTRVLRIFHERGRDVDIVGSGGNPQLEHVSYDDPHLAAGAPLGAYPAGVIDWNEGAWQIGVPNGKFATFNVTLQDPSSTHAGFRFHDPHIFAGVDIYNGSTRDATIVVRSKDEREIVVTLNPGELRHLRTGWRNATTAVDFEYRSADGLRFDNLAYR